MELRYQDLRICRRTARHVGRSTGLHISTNHSTLDNSICREICRPRLSSLILDVALQINLAQTTYAESHCKQQVDLKWSIAPCTCRVVPLHRMPLLPALPGIKTPAKLRPQLLPWICTTQATGRRACLSSTRTRKARSGKLTLPRLLLTAPRGLTARCSRVRMAIGRASILGVHLTGRRI